MVIWGTFENCFRTYEKQKMSKQNNIQGENVKGRKNGWMNGIFNLSHNSSKLSNFLKRNVCVYKQINSINKQKGKQTSYILCESKQTAEKIK